MPRVSPENANKRHVTEDDLEDDVELRDDVYVPICKLQGSRKRAYAFGYGDGNRMNNFNGYSYADLETEDGDAIEGDLRVSVFETPDLEDRKATLDAFDIQSLRESADESMTDREIIPVQDVAAGHDEVAVLEVRVEDEFHDEYLNPEESNVKIPYSEWRE